ncbi:hypothetical protein A3L04_07735 [Thermococcus chitonophagus]|uniref:Uncharacterized protein n=1 Tax=Thermococcus chitonophagus TaxID=54262 RepID=A0A160VTL0_9EURY|nr:hypothetical protein [Thermococcus chitonophagus]ASJ16973.1 hypothetical protein A3L04_07735 [Thermococcus chitonophagus]CUX78455.1 hypothetical protein CHITON_1676 [Thermococcus chitonophagus]
MKKSILAVLVLLVIFSGALGYLLYGYAKFDSTINPKKQVPVGKYVVIQLPPLKDVGPKFLVLTLPEYVNLTVKGWKPPAGSKGYLISIKGYITGVPEVDLNMTMLAKYDKFTIVVGSPEVRVCSSDPNLFTGSCEERTLAVSEITVVTSMLFKRYYYWEALKKGLDNESAKKYAFEQTMKRKSIRYLSFLTKAEIGLGMVGNKDNLCVVLMGPAEGADSNEILIIRPGLIILKGKTDAALRAEVVLIERLLNITMPS